MFISSALGRRDAGLVRGAAFYRSARLLLGLNIYKLSAESLELRIDGRVSCHPAGVRWLIPGLGDAIQLGQRIPACREFPEPPQNSWLAGSPCCFGRSGDDGRCKNVLFCSF